MATKKNMTTTATKPIKPDTANQKPAAKPKTETEPKSVATTEPAKTDAPEKQEKKPTTPGVRAKRTRPYLAGVIIAKHGLAAGVTNEMVAELDKEYGHENPAESIFALRNSWHAARGYTGLDATTAAGLTVAGVLDAFPDAHRPISNHFSTGCGLSLQNLDATIARWVLFEMMVSNADECVPVLPIHDSFITFTEYADRLRDAMRAIYSGVMQQHTGSGKDFEIPIK